MGVYPLGTMDDSKKEVNKIKRPKNDQVTQAVLLYLHKRNYPITAPTEITKEEMELEILVNSEISTSNSIIYSCCNSDPAIIDHSYLKFVAWVKEINKTKNYEDLYYIVGPLFCHLYLELSQRGHSDRAANFLKLHLSSVDKIRSDDIILRLLNIFTNDIPDLSNLKKSFRSSKYVINLNSSSVSLLKKFLAESCHNVMLQIFQMWFQINENDEADIEDNENIIANLTNGHHINQNSNLILKKVKDAIAMLKKENTPLYTVSLGNLKDDVTCGKINREASLAIYSYNSGIFLSSLRTLKQLEGTNELSDVVLRGHRSIVYDMSYIPVSNHLVSASRDKTLKLFDLNNYREVLVYKGHDHPVYCVATSKNGHYIISGSYDRTARLWSIENNNTLRVCIGHTQEITSIDFHPNALYFCTGSADKNIRMWTINDSNPVRLFLGSKGIIYALSYSTNGRYLASSGDDKKIRIWDLVAGKQLSEIKVGTEPVVEIVWNSDDSVLCAGTLDGIVRNWDIASIIKNPQDSALHNTKYHVSLNAKLLSLEYSCDTFACLTARTSNSSYCSI